ncbi:MAG: glutamine--tRNA ligase, partial [Nitrospirota bacterium]|nr:glutamine--tRNA ligase [Nitrospirota bacterium]
EVTGNITAIRCTFDPDTKRGGPQAGRKVKGTIHWVSVQHALPVEIRLYEALLVESSSDTEGASQDSHPILNPRSLQVLGNCWAEPGLKHATVGSRFQFERQGYFCLDPDSSDQKLVFNRTVPLRDSWAKIEKK